MSPCKLTIAEQLGGIELERLDALAQLGPFLAQKTPLLALEQQLADAIFDDEANAAARFRVVLELAVGASGRERVDEKIVGQLAHGGQQLPLAVGLIEDALDDTLHELPIDGPVLMPDLDVCGHG